MAEQRRQQVVPPPAKEPQEHGIVERGLARSAEVEPEAPQEQAPPKPPQEPPVSASASEVVIIGNCAHCSGVVRRQVSTGGHWCEECGREGSEYHGTGEVVRR